MSDCCSPQNPQKKSSATQSCCGGEEIYQSEGVSAPLIYNAAEKSCCAPVAAEKAGDHGEKKVGSCCAPSVHDHSHHLHDHSHHHYDAGQKTSASCCDADEHSHNKTDYLLWVSLALCSVFYVSHLLIPSALPDVLSHFAHSIFEMLNTMWWGVLVGLIFVGLLAKVPQSLVLSILGKGGTLSGLVRATAAGVLLDLCSHGILMVGMKLYQKGASLGQVMAFLIASPWNSFSLTIIMFSLIGFKWTIAFIVLSMVIALISGWVFDRCVDGGILPKNPHGFELADDFHFVSEVKSQWASIEWSPRLLSDIVREGLSGSRMVLRWLLFGVLLAALIRTFVSLDFFQHWFGPSTLGLIFTLIAATVIEVCSEGSTPIAADLLNRALAPGNAFTFMMAGVSTDYTEMLVLKDTTKSWKIAFFLPLITLPQIIVVAFVLNNWH